MFSPNENTFNLPVRQKNGCRSYGPRDENKNLAPPIGCELFVARIPAQFPHKELIKLFYSAGEIYDIRIMLNFLRENKGYAFVRYTSPEAALGAIEIIHGYNVFNKGKLEHLVATRSTDHRTLMLTNVSPRVTSDEIEQIFQDIGSSELLNVRKEFQIGRTAPVFYLLFASHRAAALVKRSKWRDMIPQHWGMRAQLDWEPNEEVNQRELYKLEKTLNRNLMGANSSQVPLENRGFPRSVLTSQNSLTHNSWKPTVNRPLPPTAGNSEMNFFVANFEEERNLDCSLSPDRLLPIGSGFNQQLGACAGPSGTDPQLCSSGIYLQNEAGGIGSSNWLEGAWGGTPSTSAAPDDINLFVPNDSPLFTLFGRPIRGRGINDQFPKTMRF